ncbi:UDP-N-acetylmuramoyl-L-alanyl-D-glutamate--2,6-diaminopimelate ligase [Candidatus Poribacteria bacterium]|nr:UDP-N-acetylmuramoyl-L-alanyl-D-glutamate--2,6-diaminopimelate ligase [Candidatus Poribacteria bacterium]MYG09139.1 UDP-N-acetylmuramoyl-L-alanyl-D-glutamate--2,6-diaminopimelate ligase [Candidatus Poribacteria bacterium]MYK21748.1 UDP-N-acetylmuramoyl-L-alanyl-D-glutamate--2,6-diaminopimelate ligase [Candidatus Poribacteria bacterium]
MKLRELLHGLNLIASTGSLDIDITGIVSDNREVEQDNIFLCYEGIRVDSHIFVADALQKGAAAIIGEKPVTALEIPTTPVTYVQVPNGRRAMSLLAANWHGNPAKHLKLIGITGTNGKTSTAHLIHTILKSSGQKTALIGTVGHQYTNTQGEVKTLPASLTTPDAFALHDLFKQFVKAEVEYVTMETSSQGLALQRLAGLTFDTAVFTNFTQDHLDYHQTMEAYLKAKLMLFEQLSEEGVAVLNSDAPVSKRIAETCLRSRLLMYGLNNKADLHAEDIAFAHNRLAFTAVTPEGRFPVKLRLLGEYNLYNALAAIAVGIRYGCPMSAIQEALAATVVPGRFELIDQGQDFAVIVDYAHTPDGLENVLTAAKRITEQKLICVFGCGGDRDNGKRPKMGNISAQIADYSVITSDNPRTENPDAIIAQIVSNLPHDTKYVCISERRDAIHHAIATAKSGDVVVIAGKGHEDYQEIHGKRFPFDDRVVASDILESL